MKRWMILALVAATGVLFTACDKGAPASNPEAKAQGATAEQPEELPPLNIEVKPQRLALGDSFTCYLNDKSELWCWGWGEEFPVIAAREPLPPTKQDIGIELTSIDAYQDSICGIGVEGTVYCWGDVLDDDEPAKGTPVLTDAVDIAVGASFVCATQKSGDLACVGRSISGVVPAGHRSTPLVFPASRGGWRLLDAGTVHVCSVNADGELFCWGHNNYGQLGVGDLESRNEPTLVTGLREVTDVAIAGMNTCSLNSRGEVSCWGPSRAQALGRERNDKMCGGGDKEPCSNTPVRVELQEKAKGIQVGTYHSCALSRDGTVKCWGAGRSGQLGNGTNIKSSGPILAKAEGTLELRCGDSRCCVTTFKGVDCWGQNPSGASSPGGPAKIFDPASIGEL